MIYSLVNWPIVKPKEDFEVSVRWSLLTIKGLLSERNRSPDSIYWALVACSTCETPPNQLWESQKIKFSLFRAWKIISPFQSEQDPVLEGLSHL